MRIFGLLIVSLFLIRAEAASMAAYTEELPPYDFQQDGKIAGLSTELLQAMCAEAKIDCPVKILPWARSFREALNNPNSILFSTARTPSRESSFLWIGPISQNLDNILYVRQDSPLNGTSIRELQSLRVGVVIGDSAADQMVRAGVTGVIFDPAVNVEINLRKLMAGHIDLLPAQEVVMKWAVKAVGLDMQAVRALFPVGHAEDLYFAINPRSDPAMVEALRAAWARISATSQPLEIKRRYIPDMK
jgi:polar amino acid transport system substrate-binding protein